MADSTDPLVLDLVEWIAREPRLYSEVIETWRTSCPRLTIWEDAVDRGYVARETISGSGSEGGDHRGRRQVAARARPGRLTRLPLCCSDRRQAVSQKSAGWGAHCDSAIKKSPASRHLI